MDAVKRNLIKRLGGFAAAAALVCAAGFAQAQQPIKIGMGIAQTGPLGSGGKASLVAMQMWRDEVNAKGGLLGGRKIELIAYDDQSNPSVVPGIYTKLLDIDKVDLIVAPYGTNQTAPIMPLVKSRELLLIGNFSYDINRDIKHPMYFNNSPWGSGARMWGETFLQAGRDLGGKTVAFLAADAEFAQALATGSRAIAKAMGFQVVYDQNYPPNTVEFSSMFRAVRATKPDIVFIASYPAESAAMVRALKEIGLGSSVKLLGGGMVGLQFAANMEALGSSLNGIVNYNTYVPEKSLTTPAMSEFLKRYQSRAVAEKVDPLGFYLPPYGYAIGQMLEQAITATKGLDQKAIAAYMRTNEMKTIVGNFKFDGSGEWATPKMVMAQFRGIKDKDIEQFREPGKQVIVGPAALKSGAVVSYEEARKGK